MFGIQMEASMVRKRPCGICGRWFLPNKRAGNRQRVCSREECQRERHRRACGRWHKNNPGYDRERRLREKLERRERPRNGPQGVIGIDPLCQVNWETARDVVGVEVCVVIEKTGEVLKDWARDVVISEVHGIINKNPKVPPYKARDAIGKRAPP